MDWLSWGFGVVAGAAPLLVWRWLYRHYITDRAWVRREIHIALQRAPRQTLPDLHHEIRLATEKCASITDVAIALTELQQQKRIHAQWVEADGRRRRVYWLAVGA
jgi:hypothetical protein